jgi:hypothetical protein
VQLLTKFGGFWGGFVSVIGLFFVVPVLGSLLGIAPGGVVAGSLLFGSLVIIWLLSQWAGARWARQRRREETGRGEGPPRIVWVNEVGRWRIQTFVLTFEQAGILLAAKSSQMLIPFDAVESIRLSPNGALRADTAVVSTGLFGPIELTPLGDDGVVPDRRGESAATLVELAQSLSAGRRADRGL